MDTIHNIKKTKAQLIHELQILRQRVTELERSEAEHKRAEEALRQSENLFQSLIETLPQNVFSKDLEGRFTFANQRYCLAQGKSLTDIIGKTDFDLHPPEMAKKYRKDDHRVIETGRLFETVEEHQPLGKEKFYVQVIKTPIYDSNGQITGILGIFWDITESKRAEEALRASEERFRLAAESLSDVIYEWDLGSNVQWFGNIDEILGYAPGEFPRTMDAWVNILHPDDRDRVWAAVERQLRGEATYDIEYRVRHNNGEWRHWLARGTVLRDASGKAVRWIGAISDTTERKRAEEALRALSSRQEAILSAVPDIIMEVNVNKVYTWANQAGVEFFGPDVVGKEAAEYFEGEQETYHVVQPLFNGNENVIYIESWQRRQDGERRLLAWWCQVLKDVQGNVIGALSTARDITERKRAEQVLQASERNYRQLYESMMDAYVKMDMSGAIVECNRVYQDMLGYSKEELPRLTYVDLTPARWHEFEAKIVAEQILPRGYSDVYEKEYIRKDGTIFPVELRTFLIKDEDEQPAAMWAIVRDITKRKQAEEKLQQQQERFLAIFNNFPEILYVSDPETYEVLFVNKIFEELLGRNPVGSLCYTAFQGFEKPCEFCTNDIILQDRKPYIWEYHNPVLNKNYLLTDQIIKWPDGRDVRFEVAIDITDRRYVEEALRASESKYKTLVENIPQKIFTKDRNSMYISCNENFARDLGVTPEEFGGKTDYDFFPNELADKYRADDQRIMEAGSTENIEEKYLQDGQEFWVQTIKTPIKDEKGNVVGMLGVFWDITERKHAEEERGRLMTELAQKNKELEQIVYVTSHDLRSPLVNVQGFSKELKYSLQELSSLFQREGIPEGVKEEATFIMEDDIQEDLKYILTGIAKMDTLLSGLLRLSRLGRAALTITPLNMNKLIVDVTTAVEFQIQEAGITLDVSDLPPCQGDALQINQVFSNLLGNALKFLDPNRLGIIKIWGYQEHERAIYCVEDNGIGIAPEHQEKVFDIFHRLNPAETSGEGLGLTIVRRILDRHDGTVWVESEVGEGSKFYVSLPEGKMEYWSDGVLE